jgi:hypothetical protein
MVLRADKDEEASRRTNRGLALIAIGTSISLDELAISERWREHAEQAAGIALILLRAYLVTVQLAL